MAVIGTTDLIIELLDQIDKNNPKDVLTSIRLFSDGSGRILQQYQETISDFNTTQEAVLQLQKMLDECLKVKSDKK